MIINYLNIVCVLLLATCVQLSARADQNFKIEDCDELIALQANHSGMMLCWWEIDSEIIGKYTYKGKIYKGGKFSNLKDGVYSAKRNSRSIRVDDGNLLFHKNRVYLKFTGGEDKGGKENSGSKNYFADFYSTGFERVYHRVYIGYLDRVTKKIIISLAKDGKYQSRNGVFFEIKDGFLPVGCTYEIEYSGHFLRCEDLN